MTSATRKTDYAARDQKGKVVFYVLLWKRQEVEMEVFDEYWRNVHGPVCGRLPGQHQYWQFHVTYSQANLWSRQEQKDLEYSLPPEDQFDGIAELTFTSEAERQTWFDAASILMNDEPNIFSKAIGYNTNPGNSKTYIDRIEIGDPNGALDVLKFHVMVKKADSVGVEAFRRYMKETFATSIVQSDAVLKFRLHLFEEVNNSRADATGVVHTEPLEKQYQGAFEIAFANSSEMKRFLTSHEYAEAAKNQPEYIKQLVPFSERSAYTFVYDSELTLAGQRSSTVAELINKVEATNQLQEDIVSLMLENQLIDSQSNGHTRESQNQSQKKNNYYKDLAADYSRPGLVSDEVAEELIEKAKKIIAKKEESLPEIDSNYSLEQIEKENKEWWPTHCEALRQRRGDILTAEYRNELVYFCQDGPYHGLEQQKEREKHWWAIISQPGITMCWPIVMFHGEIVFFEWKCVDDQTNETTAKGTVSWIRRGHRGACYLKTEQLTFYRDVFAPDELLKLVTT